MRNKEFREIQVSSSALVFIFLAILVLGVFIFLLGVSVGKKQAQMAGPTTLLAERPIENVAPQTPIPAEDRSVNVPARDRQAETVIPPQRAEKEPSTKTVDTGSGGKPEAASGADQGLARKATPAEVKPAVAKVTDSGSSALKTGAYFIQVGALNDKSQASVLASRFRKQGYSVVVLDPFATDRKTVYRVRIGGFATREQAAQALSKLNAGAGKKTGYYIIKD